MVIANNEPVISCIRQYSIIEILNSQPRNCVKYVDALLKEGGPRLRGRGGFLPRNVSHRGLEDFGIELSKEIRV
jgi:hypothetical protein